MTWKSTAVVSGAGLLATWLASYAPPAGSPPPAAAPAAAVAMSDAEIQQEATRLQQQVRSVVEYAPPMRNPFRFTATAPGAPVASAPAAVIPDVAAPAAPDVTLTGVALDTVDGRDVRTAILSTPAGLVFATVGEVVAGYRVAAIAEDAVQLTASDGSTITVR